LPLSEEKGFAFQIEDLKDRISKNTKMLIVCSPHNPTGSTLRQDELNAIADLAKDHDFWVYSDEVYSTLVYDDKFRSIASCKDMYERTIVVDCVSKAYSMTGWRLGYAANPTLAPHFARWMTNTDSCANHPTQWAVVEALNSSQEESLKMTASFKERRDILVEALNEIKGIKCNKPGGAIYVWPNVTEAVKNIGFKSAEELRKKLLDCGVAVLADIHFGPKFNDQEYIRLSLATSKEDILEGIKRIKKCCE